MSRSIAVLVVVARAVAGCAASGGEPAKRAPEPVDVAPVEAAAAQPAPPPPDERTLPTACAEGPLCTLPADFAQRLCAGSYPEVALHLFAPGTPWKRAYLQRSFKAWHVGGRGDLREVRSGEEVIILTAGSTDGQKLQIGGQAFDVLRWDGTCVSLMEDELSFRKPPAAAVANITWKKLDPAFQSALSEERHIESLREAQLRICESKAADSEPGKSKCELARRQLSLAIAQAVGRGKALPPLASVP